MAKKKAGDYLESLNSRGIVPGLESIKRLLEELGSPQDFLKFVHITGTNGKGSTSCFLSSVFNKAGIKHGRFNSPTVFDITEDISVNGNPISSDEFIELEEVVRNANDRVYKKYGIMPTSFESETAMALYYFNKQNVDIVILECGMGGLSDATNVINSSICSVITSVSLEHTAYLGESVREIAGMKAGIIKPHSAVFVPNNLNNDAIDVIREAAKDNNSFMFFVKPFRKYHFDAEYQYSNAGLAVDVCYYLKRAGYRIPLGSIEDGIREFYIAGRYEKIYSNPEIIIDGAHNPEAVSVLVDSLKLNYPGKKLRMVFGAFKDKDIDSMIKIMAPICKSMIAVKVPTNRAEDENRICNIAKKYGVTASAMRNPIDAIEHYLSETDDTPIICFGSLSYLNLIKKRVKEND